MSQFVCNALFFETFFSLKATKLRAFPLTTVVKYIVFKESHISQTEKGYASGILISSVQDASLSECRFTVPPVPGGRTQIYFSWGQ